MYSNSILRSAMTSAILVVSMLILTSCNSTNITLSASEIKKIDALQVIEMKSFESDKHKKTYPKPEVATIVRTASLDTGLIYNDVRVNDIIVDKDNELLSTKFASSRSEAKVSKVNPIFVENKLIVQVDWSLTQDERATLLSEYDMQQIGSIPSIDAIIVKKSFSSFKNKYTGKELERNVRKYHKKNSLNIRKRTNLFEIEKSIFSVDAAIGTLMEDPRILNVSLDFYTSEDTPSMTSVSHQIDVKKKQLTNGG